MTEISEQAKLKACKLADAVGQEQHVGTVAHDGGVRHPHLLAFARCIQQTHDKVARALELLDTSPTTQCSLVRSAVHEVLSPLLLPEPINPLLIEARQAVASVFSDEITQEAILAGRWDDGTSMRAALAALRRRENTDGER